MEYMTNLNQNADFSIEIFPNVFWVPANSLGQSRYSVPDIHQFVPLLPEEKSNKIRNLYEAIQLFQESKFYGYIDNVRVLEEETTIMWAFHKPGYHSVRTNGGCCAANSNWLCYILKDKYQEIGCFGYCLADGNGHITNYIKNNNEYFFVDMMMQRYDSLEYTGYENGDIVDYKQHDFTGYIYKTASLQDYISFLMSNHLHNPILYYLVRGECFAVGNPLTWQKINELWSLTPIPKRRYCFHKDYTEILHTNDESFYELRSDTALIPAWSSISSYNFSTLKA